MTGSPAYNSRSSIALIKKLGELNTRGVALSNTVYIDQNLNISEPENKIFINYDEACTWVQSNANLTPNNLWQVFLCAGNVGTIKLYQHIKVVATDGTIIERLESDVDFTSLFDMWEAYLSGGIINELALTAGKCIALFNCIIKDVTPATGMGVYYMNDCSVFGGNLENYMGYQFNSKFISMYAEITNLYLNGNNINVEVEPISGNEVHITTADITQGIFKPTSFIKANIENCRCDTVTATGTETSSFTNCKISSLVLAESCTVILKNSIVNGNLTIGPSCTLINTGAYYDNRNSGLIAVQQQAAIDEIVERIKAIEASM